MRYVRRPAKRPKLWTRQLRAACGRRLPEAASNATAHLEVVERTLLPGAGEGICGRLLRCGSKLAVIKF